MLTETIQAWQIEEGDVITLGGETTYTVAYTNDEGDSISLVLTDEDGETDRENVIYMLAWESVTLVTSLYGDPAQEDRTFGDLYF